MENLLLFPYCLLVSRAVNYLRTDWRRDLRGANQVTANAKRCKSWQQQVAGTRIITRIQRDDEISYTSGAVLMLSGFPLLALMTLL